MRNVPFRWPLVPWLSVSAIVVATALFCLRPAARELRGDEGSYVAMAASLARDFDLRFDESDRAWAESPERAGVALILQSTPDGVFYSKPILYPLLTAVFVGALGAWGAAIFNALALGLAIRIAWLALARRDDPADRIATRDVLATFAATGLGLVYLPWRMTESLQLALALAGLALTFGALRGRPVGPRAALGGAALLGLLASLREPNALIAAVPVFAALALRERRRAGQFAIASAAGYLAVALLTWSLTGAINPYKAPRATFNAETGFPAGARAQESLARFEGTEHLATSTLGGLPEFAPAISAYATFYSLFGRHTGLLWYMPAAAIFFLAAGRRTDRPGAVALAGFAGLALFYLVWLPVNYFGGETFVGNRYLLAATPLALVAFRTWPTRRILLAVWAIAAFVALSAVWSVRASRDLDLTSQSHASAGLFRWLPYESTASNIDGRRDRYWAGDFVRFVDPFAAVAPWSFEIAGGAPAAELEIAARRGAWTGEPLHFLARADGSAVTIEVSDFGRTERFALEAQLDGSSGGLIRFDPSPAWRRHPFWWNAGESYSVRMVRLRALAADGTGGRVRLRYLGRSAPPARGFEREVVALELLGEPVAGGRSELALEIVNRGSFAWTSGATLPVQIGVRMRAIDSAGTLLGETVEARVPIEAVIRPGETLRQQLPIDWPGRAGRYRVSVDLVMEDVAWFEDRTGEPLARRDLEVVEVATVASPDQSSGRSR